MMNNLKIGEKYICSFGTEPIHIANVIDVDDKGVVVEFLESKMRDRGKWIKDEFKGRQVYRLVEYEHKIWFYHIKNMKNNTI